MSAYERAELEVANAVTRIVEAVIRGTLDAIDGQPILRALPFSRIHMKSETENELFGRIRAMREKVTGSAEFVG